MNATLHALADLYRKSSAGRNGAAKDYTLDWEKFLRETNRHDGDARELAEQELRASVAQFPISLFRQFTGKMGS